MTKQYVLRFFGFYRLNQCRVRRIDECEMENVVSCHVGRQADSSSISPVKRQELTFGFIATRTIPLAALLCSVPWLLGGAFIAT